MTSTFHLLIFFKTSWKYNKSVFKQLTLITSQRLYCFIKWKIKYFSFFGMVDLSLDIMWQSHNSDKPLLVPVFKRIKSIFCFHSWSEVDTIFISVCWTEMRLYLQLHWGILFTLAVEMQSHRAKCFKASKTFPLFLYFFLCTVPLWNNVGILLVWDVYVFSNTCQMFIYIYMS